MNLVNMLFFLSLSSALSKCINKNNTQIGTEVTDWHLHVKIIRFNYPLVNWMCIRYQYHMPFNLLVHTIVHINIPLTYFYSFLRPGTTLPRYYVMFGVGHFNSFQMLC